MRIKESRKQSSHHKIRRFVVLAAGTFAVCIIIAYFLFQVHNIEYIGSSHYANDEMTEKIFGSEKPNALFYLLFGNKSKQIPFVQKYEVEMKWPDNMIVTVYEKPIVGYINYMGCNMFFDKDGIVVESSSETYKGVPEIEGLVFSSIVLNQKLEINNTGIFLNILDLTQSFDKYELNVNKIYFDNVYNVTLYLNNIKVILGNPKDCNDRIFALKQMEDKIKGLKGTLYLSDYDGSDSSVIFKQE